tara:strand:- start:51 stop:239 length:189 start_codon:yes stop_codon:yes gene_type:complete
MKTLINIDMGNAAFSPDQHVELCRLLRHAADKLENHWNQGEYHMALVDVNGNRVGKLEVLEK